MKDKQPIPLARWMNERGTPNSWIADRANTSRETIRKIRIGDSIPRPDLAARISTATNGEIKVLDLLYPTGKPDGVKF